MEYVRKQFGNVPIAEGRSGTFYGYHVRWYLQNAYLNKRFLRKTLITITFYN